MKLNWTIESQDIETLKQLIEDTKNKDFVRERIERNVTSQISEIPKNEFWKYIVGCLLTTQQKSGPRSAVSRLINTDPFPLDYNILHEDSVKDQSLDILTNFGGIRRSETISKEIEANYKMLKNGFWQTVYDEQQKLIPIRNKNPSYENIQIERNAALSMQKLNGLGPKQSRNLLQWSGLTRYEIPIDSRIIKWLNGHNFPIKLSANGLSDENYYSFVLNGIHEWCKAADIIPTIFDAAVFSLYD